MRRERILFWAVAVSSGALQAWRHRFWIEPDGVNYLDIAAAYLRHDWATAINPYWSPLYSWLLATALYLTRTSAYWESTLLHVLNFAVFLFALWCGELLITELVRARKEDWLPSWALWWIGYCVLLFVSLFMISLYLDTPDLCTSALVYAATCLLLRMRSEHASWATPIVFGLALGAGYLAKTVMFLIAFAFLFAAGWSRRTALSFACFAAISLPWILVLSHSEKRLTYGDAGWANYCFYVSSSGRPLHPPRILFASPEIHEFAVPIRATYPPWFNPIYWMEGVHPHFDLRTQILVAEHTGKEYLHELSGQKEFIFAFIGLLVISRRRATIRWRALWPPFAAMGLYGLVHVEARLIGPFFAVFWLILFSGLRVPAGRYFMLIPLAVVLVSGLKIERALVRAPANTTHVEWEAASALRRQGVMPGSRVADFAHTTEADYWAHLASVQISADLQKGSTAEFQSLPLSAQQEIFARLAKAGVRAVVIKSNTYSDEWMRIPGTPYSVHFLGD